jgi:glycosyltransferase involved in cell wall biosynthesis
MRILHTVEFYSPSVGGAQEVVRQVSERLVERGHDVTVATTKLPERSTSIISGVHVEEFAISGNAVRGYQGETDRYQHFLLDGAFDLMMNYAAQQWATDLVFPILHRIPYRKVLATCGFSGLFMPEYASYFARMPDIMRRYDRLIFHSHTYRDAELARTHDLGHYTVIPNGAAQSEFAYVDSTFRKRYGVPEDVPLLLTVGSHTGLKGHALVIEAFRKARVGRAVLAIIGNALSRRGCLPDCRRRAALVRLVSLGRKKALLLDPPRADVVAAFHAADLFLLGSKVECSPLVLFEAMASRTPFVTVACGNAEEIVDWGQGGVVVPTRRRPDGTVHAKPRAMARVIEQLITNAHERHRLAQAGYRAWQEQFSWESIAGRYEQAYQETERRRDGDT